MNSEEIFLTSCSVEYKTAQVAKVSVSPHIYSQLISLSHISFNLVSTNICSIFNYLNSKILLQKHVKSYCIALLVLCDMLYLEI